VVALLLEHKADIHADEDDALRYASYGGHKDVIEIAK
jgi:hypothetical protein